MTSTRPKYISGQEFNGRDMLVFEDIQDWIVTGFGEGSKQQLDEMDWEGDAIVSVGLTLSQDNKKITSGKIYTHGELMRSNKDFRANRLFENIDKDLRIFYQIEDFSIFKFNNGRSNVESMFLCVFLIRVTTVCRDFWAKLVLCSEFVPRSISHLDAW